MSPVYDGQIKQIFKARLEIAVEKCVTQGPVIVIPHYVHVFFQNNSVFR